MNFLEALENVNNRTLTDNGAPAFRSTMNDCLDFFGMSSRTNVENTVRLFNRAFIADPETAIRTLFYFRDVRGGQGERAFVHACLKSIASDPRMRDLIRLLPEYGYWKDILIFHDTSAWDFCVEFIRETLNKDIENMADNKPVSLLAKWLPSNNAGKSSRALANSISVALGYTERQYRKVLARLRAHIKIVETNMCNNEWGAINYPTVPSRAHFMYRNAFKKHDSVRYIEYISKVKSGEIKINAKTLYPCEIFSKVRYEPNNSGELDVMWKALPNYINKPYNGLVIADTSGSMRYPKIGSFSPLDVSMSLATYIAERNPSEIWKNKFLIFSNEPELLTLKGNSLSDYVKCFPEIVSSNTDLIKVAELIVKAGKNNNIPDSEMPSVLTIISDMQFDNFNKINGVIDSNVTPHKEFSSKFTKAGYSVPKIIYWNVNNSKNVPVTFDEYGTAFVTGFSPSAMIGILGAETTSPVDIMVKTVYNERYDPVGNLFKVH